jgi:hypothetical protein
MHRALLVTAALLAGCDRPEPQQVLAYPVPYTTRVEVQPETRIIVPSMPASTEPAWGEGARAARVDIVITTARKLDRPTEVVGVIDAHEPSGEQDAAMRLLRERAASMGADAVVGVEFHHGEEKDEPTHLSGLAVRFVDRSP